MKTILIDDEPRALETLEYHLTELFDDFNVIAKFDNIKDGLSFILKNKADVLFLDINMPKGSGLELIEQLSGLSITTIFVTAHSEFAIEAIKLNIFDYLLKPIDLSELKRVHDKLKNKVGNLPCSKKVKIKISSNNYLFDQNDITHVVAEGNYTIVHSLNHKKITISKNIKKVENEFFSSLPFFRIHQTYIVNINHIIEFSNHEVVLKQNFRIPISKANQKDFLRLMSKY